LEKAAFIPTAAGMLAALVHRNGETERAQEMLQKLPADSFGGQRARAAFYWVCGDLDAVANWWERAIDQRDPAVPLSMRVGTAETCAPLRTGRG
jgi:hypothetical protein